MANEVVINVKVNNDTKPGLDKVEADTKASGTKAGDNFAKGVTPVMMAAFTGIAAAGPAAILGGTALAVAGIGSLVLRSNDTIKAEYAKLGDSVSTVLKEATAPLEGPVVQSMQAIGQQAQQLEPQLTKLFAGVAPDIKTVTDGALSFASHALPGISTALSGAQVILRDFSNSLGPLGTSVGSFFTSLTKNSSQVGSGIQAMVGVVGNAISTLGSVVGNASGMISQDLAAIAPAINGVLAAVRGLSSPETVGGLIGAFSAMKFGPAISSGLTSASEGMLNLGARAEEAGGKFGKLSGVALGASSGLSTMAGIMSGPWGIAIGAGVGLLGGLISSFSQAKVSANDFTQAISQDSGVVGANTTAIIQQKLAKMDLTKAQKDLGVSQSTLIEYAAGDKAAQQQVTAAYNEKVSALSKTAGVTYEYGKTVYAVNNASQQEINTLKDAKSSIDQVTNAVAQAIAKENDQTRAYLAATNSANIFGGMVQTAALKLQANSVQTGINTVAALGLSSAQGELAQQLAGTVTQFQENTAGASAYKSTLDALFGKYQDYSQAQATFTTDLADATKQLTAGTHAMDLNNAVGAKNFTVLGNLATQNKNVAEALYKQTGNMGQANAALQKGALQIDALAKSAGLTDGQVAQLNKDLYGTSKIGDIKIGIDVDTSQISAAQQAINNLKASAGSPTGRGGSRAQSGGYAHGGITGAAVGGPRAGLTLVGENGPELVHLPVGSTVMSNPDTQGAMANMGGGGTQHVQVELVISGAENEFLTFLRKAIRARGGNANNSVQLVLGQSF